MISPAFLFILSKFDLQVFKGVKEQKMTQHYQFQSFTLYISGAVDHIIKIFGTQVENNVIPGFFFIFYFLNTTL